MQATNSGAEPFLLMTVVWAAALAGLAANAGCSQVGPGGQAIPIVTRGAPTTGGGCAGTAPCPPTQNLSQAHRQTFAVLAFDQLSIARQTAVALLNRPAAGFSAGKSSCIRYSVIDPNWLALADYACQRSRQQATVPPRTLTLRTTGQERLQPAADGRRTEAVANLRIEASGGSQSGVRAYALSRTLRIWPVAAGSDGAKTVAYELNVSYGAADDSQSSRLESWTLSSISQFSAQALADGSLDLVALAPNSSIDFAYHGPQAQAAGKSPPLAAQMKFQAQGPLDFPPATAFPRCRFPRGSVVATGATGASGPVSLEPARTIRLNEAGFADSEPRVPPHPWDECD